MTCPIIEIDERKIILLSGFESQQSARKSPSVVAKDELQSAVKRHQDAVAFGYFNSRWVPAA